MLIALSRRPAQLGPTINDRTEKHGNEDKPALDLSVTGFVLTREEYNTIAGHPGAFDAVFDHSSNPPKFAYPNLVPQVALVETIKGCAAAMYLGLEQYELNLGDVSLKGGLIALEKGIAALSFKLQFEGELSGEQLLKLRAAKNKTVDIAVTIGAAEAKDEAQGELGLGAPADNSHADAKAKKRGRPRKSDAASLEGAVWSEERQRFESADGTPIDGTLGNGAGGEAPAAAH